MWFVWLVWLVGGGCHFCVLLFLSFFIVLVFVSVCCWLSLLAVVIVGVCCLLFTVVGVEVFVTMTTHK